MNGMRNLAGKAVAAAVASLVIMSAVTCRPARARPYSSAQSALADAASQLQGRSVETASPQTLYNVRSILDQIVQEFPSSETAVRILLEETMSGINISRLDARLSKMPPMSESRSGPSGGSPTHRRWLIPGPASLRAADQATESNLHLGRKQIAGIQGRLTALGFDPKGIDGALGPGTRHAISAWQRNESIPATGYLDPAQLARLDTEAVGPYAAWLRDGANGDKIAAFSDLAPDTSHFARRKRVWYRKSNGYYCRSVLMVAQWCQAQRPAHYPYN